MSRIQEAYNEAIYRATVVYTDACANALEHYVKWLCRCDSNPPKDLTFSAQVLQDDATTKVCIYIDSRTRGVADYVKAILSNSGYPFTDDDRKDCWIVVKTFVPWEVDVTCYDSGIRHLLEWYEAELEKEKSHE